ncbi:MAG: ROK family transcriptional regulator [Armatimonadota bacterium]
MQQLKSYLLESDIRVPATWRVLAALLQHPQITQADLRDITGLSHPVIVQQVRKLRQAGLITMGEPLGGQPGRPRTPMTFNWDFRRLLAVNVDPNGLSLQVTNLAGQPLEKLKTVPVASWTQEGIRKALQQAITKTLASRSPEWAGVGIAIPGLVSADGQVVDSLANIPDWQSESLGAELTAQFGVPVICERASDALTRAVHAEQDSSNSLLAIDLRHLPVIGSGLVINGALVPGAADHAWRLGHISVDGNALPCYCGKTGCLQTLFQASLDDQSQREPAIDGLGRVVAGLITALDSSHIVIQGDAVWSAEDFTRFAAGVHAHAFHTSRNGLMVTELPCRAEESLRGVVTRLSAMVLDLRQGMLPRWANAKEKDRRRSDR